MSTDTARPDLQPLPDARSLDDLAYQAIRSAIVSRQLRAGAPLVEARLAQQLGVSKTPVRSALRRLEAEGFVNRVPYTGVYVAEFSTADVRDLFAVRAVLEGLAVRLAAPFTTASEIEEARSLLADAGRALDGGHLDLSRELGHRWHTSLLHRASNRFLSGILDQIADHVERGRSLTAENLKSARRSIQEHHEILDAVEAHNGELAEERMRAHLIRVAKDFEWPENHTGQPRTKAQRD